MEFYIDDIFLDDIRKKNGDNKIEIIKKALSVYKWIDSEIKEDNEIFSVSKNGIVVKKLKI